MYSRSSRADPNYTSYSGPGPSSQYTRSSSTSGPSSAPRSGSTSGSSGFGLNSFGFPTFNVQDITSSLTNNFSPNFTNFMSQNNPPSQNMGQSSSSASFRPAATQRSQSTDSSCSSNDKNCEHCNTKFGYFKRKRTCTECNMDYCNTCFTSDSFLGTQSSRIGSGRQICRKCRILKLNPPDRKYLMTLRVKDLRWYLETKRVSSAGCKEKSELVDLVLTLNGYRPSNSVPHNPSSYRESSRIRRANEDVLLRSSNPNLEQDQTTNNYNSNSSTPSPSSDASSWVLVEDEPEHGRHFDTYHEQPGGAVGGVPPINSHPPNPPPPAPPITIRRPSEQSSNTNSNVTGSNVSTADQEHLQNPTVTSSSSGRESPSVYCSGSSPSHRDTSDFKAFNIDDIESEEQLSNLSIRQLKLILTRNFVDYKGCCEREELLEKVVRLWREKKAFKEQNPDEIPDENICKICMEFPIDCVLLECGHMISCVNCGKRLNECPICRQYVVRVVRTFKS